MLNACNLLFIRFFLIKILPIFCILLLCFQTEIYSQQNLEKRPLKMSDFDSWRSILGQKISQDGKFAAYALMPQDGDGEGDCPQPFDR